MTAGHAHVYPRRWQLTLGVDERGEPVTLPASQLNVAVCGGTGEGKSYLAGLICEQLVGLGYSVAVFDPEGDHIGLGELRDVLVTGGEGRQLADPAEVVRLLRHHASVVVDVSHLDAGDQAAQRARACLILISRIRTFLAQRWATHTPMRGPAATSRGRRGPDCSVGLKAPAMPITPALTRRRSGRRLRRHIGNGERNWAHRRAPSTATPESFPT